MAEVKPIPKEVTDGRSYRVIYEGKDTRPACEQIAHLMRSIFWQPNHLKSRRVKEILKKTKAT